LAGKRNLGPPYPLSPILARGLRRSAGSCYTLPPLRPGRLFSFPLMSQNTNEQTALVIGGSHAAAQLVVSLRQEGWGGKILVISDAAQHPYHRPPLSKAYLSGEKSADDLLIRSPAAYAKLGVEFRFNATATAIDRNAHTVRLDDGEVLRYDRLALCTGARVRKLPIAGAELAGVHYLRDLRDAEAIKRDLRPGTRAAIIGGGYIGLETAALLRKVGAEVCVLETMERVLQRVTAAEVSRFYTRIHREEGVRIETGVQAVEIVGDDGQRATAVRCDNGQQVAADLVIIGIGVVPNTELAAAAGLGVDNGIRVDEYAQTDDPQIVAAGDCTNHPNALYGCNLRLESVPNATEQAKSAAAAMCGKRKAYRALPWFWSDQYDLKLQIAGLNQGYDAVAVRGDIEGSRSFAAFYLQEGKVIAADCVNRPMEFSLAKMLLSGDKQIPIERLTDEGVTVKEMVAELRG